MTDKESEWRARSIALAHHGRYAHSSIVDRQSYDWPGYARLAVYVAVNLEHFAFGEGLGAELCPSTHPDVLNYSWRDYGNRVGVWRMLEMFEELALPVSVLVNSSIYGHCPEVMAAFRRRGDEVVGHGRTNSERQSGLSEEAETALIREATDEITAAEGKRPKGWLGPWISQNHFTPDLLSENGYEYLLDWCMDDQPVWFSTRNCGRILAVPYPQEVNDIPAIVARKDSPSQFAAMIVDNFDEMCRQSASGPLVMGIALHPYIVGQPYRLRHLRRALAHIAAARERIWLTHCGSISDHCRALPDGIVP